jgi:hypothetical protein
MRLTRIAAIVLLTVSALAAAKTLDMYVVDVEGGKSLLLVSPSGESMLLDAGVPGSEANGFRDAVRIVGMLDPADLTWNIDRELMCPMNRVGTVDLYSTANHGTDNANSPVMVHALRPRVVIADNAARKGASAEVFQTVESSPGLEAYWQMHYLTAGGEKANTAPDYIANIEGSPDGKWIKVSAGRDGTFTVTNTRNNFSKTYKPRK